MKLLRQHRRSGAALIIVLAFVVLLAMLALAYFSRTVNDRQVAQSSFRQTNADQLALSAADVIVGDLKQEIVNGSASPAPTFGPTASPGPYYLYVPSPSANILPVSDGTPSDKSIPNLVKRSVQNDNPAAPAVGSRASAVNSTATSLNGRSVTTARWNSHYLIPLGSAFPSPASSPVSSFVAPDWVFVTSAGPTPSPSPASVIGRYAYAIYDQGGLLDPNVAGYPSNTSAVQYGPKGVSAFADLSTIGMSQSGIDALVGWRNYFSANPSGNFPNFIFNASAASSYVNSVVSNTNGFMAVPITSPTPATLTDQQFPTRQSLIQLGTSIGSAAFPANALQDLGTFSREAGTPQWIPSSVNSINPNFQTLWVTTSFTRNDGTTANVGDYLVNKRFNLQRLNWLTYKGPSASPTPGRTIPTTTPTTPTDPNWDMWLLTSRFGLTSAFLQQGTDLNQAGQTKTTANIYKYFGLVWNAANERWNYIGHPSSPSASSPLASSIATLGTLTGTREPDFFELLQAGILSNSVGDSKPSDPALPIDHQQSTMLHILTIGANLIAQSRVDSYPVRIACTVNVNVNGTSTPTTMEAVGAARLTYLNSLAVCPVGVTQSSGGVNWLLIPNLWDPFRDSWDLTEVNVSSALTPNYLRPTVRITVTGSVGFGAVTASQSGSVNPTVTPFSTTIPIPANSFLQLTTGPATPGIPGNAFGRDGLREALRLGTSDISGTAPALFDPTQSSTGSAWNSLARPTGDTSTYRTDNFVAFRLSLAGSGITAGNTGRNPVLILKPGFQITMDYQSPTTSTTWYSYSFLQGNNAKDFVPLQRTWIYRSDSTKPGLDLAMFSSKYGANSSGGTTIVSSGTTAMPWAIATLAQAPMFAKADPRSIRYNSQIGVIAVAANSAGIIASIWPDPYATPPPMTPSAFPIPTPTPNANPATFSQLGDNGPAGSNPYNEKPTPSPTPSPTPTPWGDAVRPVMMNRPFRSVGEMGYAFRDQPFRTLSFSSGSSSNPSPDAGLLDLFCVNDYSDPSSRRAGVINLNSRQAGAIAAMLGGTFTQENTPRSTPTPAPSLLSAANATSIATSLASQTSTTPVTSKADLAAFIANQTTLPGSSVPKTQRESIARALGEADQTRTWNLLIDVIAQSGHYKPNPASLQNGFIVEGEQRYWVHVAIDRFTGQVIDRQYEQVKQ